VSESTTDILLEAAAFDPRRIRATRSKLGLSTDASYRFERGVDIEAIPDLVSYAAELIARVAGGGLDGTPTDSGMQRESPRPIQVRTARVARLLGEPIPRDTIKAYLTSIGFDCADSGDDLAVKAPSFRNDIAGEVELIEEVARVHGYDVFPSDIRPFRPGTVPDAPLDIVATRVRNVCIGAGFLEARPMPFVREGDEAHRVRNPLAEDEAYLRTSLLDTLARRVEYNFSHMQRNVRLFEIGTAFTDERAETGAPGERIHVAAVFAGDRRPAHFTEPHPPHFDEWDAKGIAETIGRAAFPGLSIECIPTVGDSLWTISAGGKAVGRVARVAVDAPIWAPGVFGFEIDLEAALVEAIEPGRERGNFRPIPAMPAMEVDLALVVPDGTSADQVADTIRQSAGELLESLEVFDEFRGQGIPEGTRSVAWRLTFRHPERTLRDREIQGRTAKILSTLEETLGIRQRTS
jgi:phenylalanyl-tRNA synthetase beta chain